MPSAGKTTAQEVSKRSEPAKPTCFVVMPISTPQDARDFYSGDGEHFRHVLDHLFVPAMERSGF